MHHTNYSTTSPFDIFEHLQQHCVSLKLFIMYNNMKPTILCSHLSTPKVHIWFGIIIILLKSNLVRAIELDEELEQKLADHPLSQVETVYTSHTGISIARATGLVSAISSILIILVIAISSTKLSTSYHRIIFGMSLSDVIASIAVFCSTWLMPQDMMFTQFQSSVLGNWTTCSLQGFFFLIGFECAFAFNTLLCIYYLNVIRYKCSEEKFRKCQEPLFFGLAIIIPLAHTAAVIKGNLIAPGPYDVACTAAVYPYWCACHPPFCDLDEHSLELCNMIPSGQSFGFTGLFLAWSLLVLYLICTAIIFISLLLVCRTAYVQANQALLIKRNPELLVRSSNNINNMRSNAQKEYEKRWYETKVVFLQALGYVFAFIFCSIFPIFSIVSVEKKTIVVQYLNVILRPLQGFFNFLIFMGHKIHNQRRSDKNLTWWRVLCKVFSWKHDDPTMFLDNIDALDNIDQQEEDKEVKVNHKAVQHDCIDSRDLSGFSSKGLSGFSSFASKDDERGSSSIISTSIQKFGEDENNGEHPCPVNSAPGLLSSSFSTMSFETDLKPTNISIKSNVQRSLFLVNEDGLSLSVDNDSKESRGNMFAKSFSSPKKKRQEIANAVKNDNCSNSDEKGQETHDHDDGQSQLSDATSHYAKFSLSTISSSMSAKKRRDSSYSHFSRHNTFKKQQLRYPPSESQREEAENMDKIRDKFKDHA